MTPDKRTGSGSGAESFGHRLRHLRQTSKGTGSTTTIDTYAMCNGIASGTSEESVTSEKAGSHDRI